MRITLLFHELTGPGPVWRNGYWPLVNLMSDIADLRLVAAPWPDAARRSTIARAARRLSGMRTARGLARALSPDMSGPEARADMVFAIALNAQAARMAAAALRRAPRGTGLRVLYLENVEAEQLRASDWAVFDRVLCFCPQLAQALDAALPVPVGYWAPHLDVLRFHDTRTTRPVDALFLGRSRTDLLFELQRRFAAPGDSRLCLDFVTRSQADRLQPAEAEFRLLFDTLAKSRATFCFAPHDVPRFKGRSPLLSRWVHAWAAGCVVLGTRPRAPEAQPLMDWPGAMIDLPDTLPEAADRVEAVLADPAALRRQGARNVAEAMARHDTRFRLRDLLRDLDLDIPPALASGLQQVEDRAGALLQAASEA